MTFVLPTKLSQYLVRLHVSYERKGETNLRDVIAASRFFVREAADHDNWNGGMWGHDVVFFLPLAELALIDVETQSDVGSGMCKLLNKMGESIQNEWFNAVYFELADENDVEYQKAQSFTHSPPINPDSLSFWKPGLARVFISHRDAHKAEARDLSEALEQYGMSCFVAHDTIQPMSEWRAEIMKGLQTMEVMLIFLTDDFTDSLWCHQEVGFALGKGVPIISLKLGRVDPPGFISHVQALRGQPDQPNTCAKGLFPLIGKALGLQGRLQDIMVTSFAASPSFIDAKLRFERMKSQIEQLTDSQADQIIAAFRANSQLHGSIYLTNSSARLKRFLEAATGRAYEFDGLDIREPKPVDPLSDDVPF